MELARLQSHIEEIIALSDSEAVVFFRAENEVWKVNLNVVDRLGRAVGGVESAEGRGVRAADVIVVGQEFVTDGVPVQLHYQELSQ